MNFEHANQCRERVRKELGSDLADKASIEFCVHFAGADHPPAFPRTIIELARLAPPSPTLEEMVNHIRESADWEAIARNVGATAADDNEMALRARARTLPLALARKLHVERLRGSSLRASASFRDGLSEVLARSGRAKTDGPGPSDPDYCWLNQSIRLRTDYRALAELASHPDVVHVDLPRRLRQELEVTGVVVGAIAFRATNQVSGAGVKVAVIDGEIDREHSALRGRVERTAKFTKEDWGKPDVHATAVAGIIAANASPSGMAPDVTIHNYKLFEPGTDPEDHDYSLALEQIVQDDVQIANCSWGSPAPTDGTSREVAACENAWSNGVTVVKSSGENGKLTCPADAEGIIVVGATDRMGVRIPSYSGRGLTVNKKQRPHLVAPGGDNGIARIRSCLPRERFESIMAGTSLAAAHVSGILALRLQSHPGQTPSELRDWLLEQCHAVDGFTADDFGAGLVKL